MAYNTHVQKNIFIFASYIKSRDNADADLASRYTNKDTEWDLNLNCFQKIAQELGQPDIDLFIYLLERDPDAYNIDAFTITWRVYFSTHFHTLCLRKIIEDSATGILVVPYWPGQPCFPPIPIVSGFSNYLP